MDYYASLGVSRTSEDVVIRAAYIALMRRHHPDANASLESAQRVREITAAYGILGNQEKRQAYDRGWDADQPTATVGPGRKPPPVGPIAFGVTILLVSTLIWAIWAQQRAVRVTTFVTDTEIARGVRIVSHPAESCSSAQVTSSVRRELIRQTTEIRGLAPTAFARMAKEFEVRTTSFPSRTQPSPGLLSCSVAIAVELPSGLASSGGQRALFGNGDYTIDVSRGADGRLIGLSVDPRLLTELASLEKAAAARNDLVIRDRANTVNPVLPLIQTGGIRRSPSSDRISRSSLPRDAASNSRRPVGDDSKQQLSPTCRGDRWSVLVCGDANLAALDHQLAVFERQSSYHADARKSDRLRISRARFESERRACSTESCAKQALVDRTTVVAEIMKEGR